MGEMGADVIKVESLDGDPARHWGPFINGESKFFQGWNRNKRGLALNLLSEKGRELLYKLVANADVVIENFRPGVTEKLKIDYASLKPINPRLIYCASTAFGPSGPYRLRPGYDPVLQSMSGTAMANIRFSGVVGISPVPFIDFQTAMLGLSGVIAALYHRERTGEGQRVETSLLQGALASQTHCFCEPLDHPEDGPVGIYPYRLFETKDSQIFIAAPTNKFWSMLCEAIGAGEVHADDRFKTNRDRCNAQEELTPKLNEFFQRRTTEEWEKLLVEKGVPCGAVRTFGEFLHDPQIEATGLNPVVENSKAGRMRMGGVAIDFEMTPGEIQRGAPILGEHTREILMQIGYTDEQISELAHAGVIQP